MTGELTAIVVLAICLGLALIAVGVLAVLVGRRGRHLSVLEQRIHELEHPDAPRRRRGLIPTPQEAVKAVWDTAVLVRDKGIGGALRSSVEDLAGWAQVERPDLVAMASFDGSVTILFSDIEGSTALNDELGDRVWVKVLAKHDKIIREAVADHDGHVIKTQGDGFMVAFAVPEQAINTACDVQREFARRNLKPNRQAVLVRMGIHSGQAVHRDGDLFGRNVAMAARVAGHANGGEVLISDAVRDSVEAHEDEGVAPMGETRQVEFKGFGGEYGVHVVQWDESAETTDADVPD